MLNRMPRRNVRVSATLNLSSAKLIRAIRAIDVVARDGPFAHRRVVGLVEPSEIWASSTLQWAASAAIAESPSPRQRTAALFSGAEKEHINTVPSEADELPHGHPADGFEHNLCHPLGDVSGGAGPGALASRPDEVGNEQTPFRRAVLGSN
jgi:hypothetical protein